MTATGRRAALLLLAALALPGCPAPDQPGAASQAAPKPSGVSVGSATEARLTVLQAPRDYLFYIKNEYGKVAGFIHPDKPLQTWRVAVGPPGLDLAVTGVRVVLADQPATVQGGPPGAIMFPTGPGAAGMPQPSLSPGESPPPPLPDSLRASPPPASPEVAETTRPVAELAWPPRLVPGELELSYAMDSAEVHAYVERNFYKSLGAHGVNRGFSFKLTLTPLGADGAPLKGAGGQPVSFELAARVF